MKNGYQIKQDMHVMVLAKTKIDTPYIRENGKLKKSSWDQALKL